jgi:glycosyltransferase 2 family protein
MYREKMGGSDANQLLTQTTRWSAPNRDPMRNGAGIVARTLREWAAANRIGIALSTLIIIAASIALFVLLRDIEIEKVIAAIRSTAPQTILTAAGFVACAYLTLTCYDFFALHTIGRDDVPYRIAALASFTGYAIGHSLGATAVTAGMVRYRIYSAHGLSLVEVAKIAFITGLTFWLGNAFLLGLGLALKPAAASAINHASAVLNRVIGLAALAAIIGYLFWLLPRPRIIGRDHWQVTLPSAPLTVAQIAIGVCDLTFVALAMKVLLPAQLPLAFLPLVVTIVMATLLGFASHTPGSIGVFDAAMLIGLPLFEKEQLLASLLIFRFLYFVAPLFFAVVVLGVREFCSAFVPRPMSPTQDDCEG